MQITQIIWDMSFLSHRKKHKACRVPFITNLSFTFSFLIYVFTLDKSYRNEFIDNFRFYNIAIFFFFLKAA